MEFTLEQLLRGDLKSIIGHSLSKKEGQIKMNTKKEKRFNPYVDGLIMFELSDNAKQAASFLENSLYMPLILQDSLDQ